MSDAEKGKSPVEELNPSQEAAASKLWAVYVSEADKYDKALVESWKNDMEGMLIFTGLFSASLTSFLVESYKTLIPDPGGSTVQLLSQISQQLTAAANGTSLQLPASTPVHFTPATSSLVCNALWFISLGLSLSCALIATLLEQWARHFLHKADMRSAPVIRARIFSYLYYGMKRFNMHTVVDIVPLLLHASLFCFFAGLVAFLLPINTTITIVAATLLAILASVYSLFTLLPMWCLDCPYHTPLSTAFWRISRGLMKIWRRRRGILHVESHKSAALPTDTMVEAMSREATRISPACTARDYRALVWTVKSLADDIELVPFVEALPDVLWGPSRRRYAYEDHIQKLIRAPDLELQSRIINLLHSCDSGLLSPEGSRRRQIICYNALWAIASVQNPQSHFQPLDFSQLVDTEDMEVLRETGVRPYSISAAALTQWSTFCFVKSQLTALIKKLEADINDGRAQDMQPLQTYLRGTAAIWIPDCPIYVQNLWEYVTRHLSQHGLELVQAVTNFCLRTPYIILFRYFLRVMTLESPPYRLVETQSTIILDPSAPFSLFNMDLDRAFEAISHLYGELNNTETASLTDRIIRTLCSFWCPDKPRHIPAAIIHYLNGRDSDIALERLLETTGAFNNHLWSSFAMTLHGPREAFRRPESVGIPLDLAKAAVWRVVWSERHRVRHPPAQCEAVLEAASDSPSPVTYSVVAMLKAMLLRAIGDFHNTSERARVPPLRHSVLPMETAILVPPDLLDYEVPAPKNRFRGMNMTFRAVLTNRVNEATIAVVADFLHSCLTDLLPYNATETLQYICETVSTPLAGIHEAHQLLLSDSMHRLWNSENPRRADMLDAIITSNIFEAYVMPPPSSVFAVGYYAWLRNSTARAHIKDTLMKYASSDNARSMRIREILDGVETLHDD
ncbi:hypothetical protein B0H19DRAFT_1381550 [Mycena capillaripes]|nr:hypothetical protein B0H19DRAFT_1381550 [Mycena capillaripes]